MKKLKQIKSHHFSRKLNSKLFLVLLISFSIMIFLYSCSNDEESINKSALNKAEKESVNKKPVVSELGISRNITQNLNLFSEKIFVNVGSLETALEKNHYVGFNEQAIGLLNAAKNENDLKVVFEMSGIANSQEIIDILKHNIEVQETFIMENPSFYVYSIEKQTELLNSSIEYSKKNYNSPLHIPASGLVGSPNCGGVFNKTINRCANDFGTCAVFAVAGAYAGLAPGLIAAAYCMVTKITCDSRAKQDYKECVYTEVNDGPPPPTGILSLHCNLDSCWTTDSNGKYIETKLYSSGAKVKK